MLADVMDERRVAREISLLPRQSTDFESPPNYVVLYGDFFQIEPTIARPLHGPPNEVLLYGDFFQIESIYQIHQTVHNLTNVIENSLGRLNVHTHTDLCENQQNVACLDGTQADRCRYTMPSERE